MVDRRRKTARRFALTMERLEERALLTTTGPGSVVGQGTLISGQQSWTSNAVAAIVGGSTTYSGSLTFTDKAVGYTFNAVSFTAVQVSEYIPVGSGPTTINSSFHITGYATLNGGSALYGFTADGSLPFPANAGSTGGTGFVVTGPNGFSYNDAWHHWDPGQTVAVSLAQPTNINSTVQLASSANPSVYGQPVTFTATVSAGTGSVAFTVDGASPTTVTLANGQASFSTSALGVGSHAVYATYSGDSTHSGAQTTLSQVVNQSATTTSLTAYGSFGPGQALTLRAAVSALAPGAGVPSGTVTFMDGTTTLGVLPVSAATSYALAYLSLPTGLPAGPHALKAVYSGDRNFSPSASDVLSRTAAPLGTATTLKSSVNPAYVGQSVTFTASVATTYTGTPAPNVKPTGNVDFYDGTTKLGSVALNSAGTAAFSTSFSTAGYHPIKAVYAGDAGYTTSTSAVLTEAVTKATPPYATKVSVVASANPVVAGLPVTFTATVSPYAAPSSAVAGVVAWYDGNTLLGMTTLANSQAKFSTSTLAVGSHTISAYFAGSPTFLASTGSMVETVNAPQPASVSGKGTTLGGQIAFAADVKATVTNGVATYSGALSFSDSKAGLSLSAVTITSVEVHEATPVVGPTGINGYFVITGVAKRPGSNDLYHFTAIGSLPFPANAGSTGGLAFNVTGPNGYTYSTPWKPWDPGESIVMTLGS